jgi:hypothetical protein
MTNLREEVLIRKSFLYFVLPWLVIGVLGAFYPYVYAFIPAHESGVCLCSYYAAMFESKSFFILKTRESYYVLQFINILAVFFVNWAFLFVLVVMIYRIRHIDDDSLIKKECVVIVAWWVGLTTIQYFVYVIM